ncbi:MAG: hypothetical protein IT433_01660 [Phycisphaerales bacterium]|nr:hypothetical protein [Phycisphaerales bacterium]
MIARTLLQLALALQPAAQPGQSGPADAPSADAPTPAALEARLEALEPSSPERYFLLAEEVADADPTPRLAVELFVLAFDLDLARPEGGRVASASVLALASLETTDERRAWLIALARTLDPRRVPPPWLARPATPSADSSAYQIATAMGLVRSGEGIRARQLLSSPHIRAALERHDRTLLRVGVPGGAFGIIREADLWPCPSCANARFLRKGRPDAAEARDCPHCLGDPGPRLSFDHMVAQLRFESWLLAGLQRSWAAQVGGDAGAPLRDPEPASVARSYLVDPRLCYRRNGEWTGTPSGGPPPMPPTPPDAPTPQSPPAPAAPSTSSSGQ